MSRARAAVWACALALSCYALLLTGCRNLKQRVPGDAMLPPEVVALAGAPAASAAEQPAETAGVEQTASVPASPDRLIVYNATLRVVVQDVAGSLEALKAMASRWKGYMQGMTQDSIVLRIPSDRFQEAIGAVEKLGEVTAREVQGQDVTEEMLDLDIRLRNAQDLRDRLLKLLEKGEKVEDLLKVETELGRVTEQIEQIKGRIKYLTHSVGYSTISVHLNSPVPQRELQEAIPFPWVQSLGGAVVLGSEARFLPGRHRRSWLPMELPGSYVRVHEDASSVRAMSGDGVMLLARREPNFEGGTVAFWGPIVRRWLTGGRAMSITAARDVTLETRARGFALDATRTFGGKSHTYRLVVIVTRDQVYTIECWGRADDVNRDREALDRAFASLKVKP